MQIVTKQLTNYKQMFSKIKILKAVIFLSAFFITTNAFSQNNRVGTWELINAEYYFHQKYFVWAEAQTRSQKVFQDFSYDELKGGFGFKPNKNITVLVGIGQYETYTIGGNFKKPMTSDELRVWEQLVLNNYISRVKIEHRYRIEQRWRSGAFRNRFRYRFNPIIPLNKSSIEPGTLFASVYDEIFLTDIGPHFERNRVFGGLGYQFNKKLMVQVGWLNQYDISASNVATNKNFLHTSVYLQLHKQ